MSNSSTNLVEELFGKDVARRTVQDTEARWGSIQRVLTTGYQEWELEPPKEGRISQEWPNTRISVCDDALTVIGRASQLYQLKSEKEAITKLLRFGLSDLKCRWGEQIKRLGEVEEAATITSAHLGTDDFTQSYLSENQSIEISARQPAQQGSKQVRILWYENELARKNSEDLGISMSDILRVAVLLAGRELGKVGDMPGPQQDRLKEQISRVDNEITGTINQAEQAVFGAINKTGTTDQAESAFSELKENCPNLWAEYMASCHSVEISINPGQ
jgi:hypothetical protein